MADGLQPAIATSVAARQRDGTLAGRSRMASQTRSSDVEVDVERDRADERVRIVQTALRWVTNNVAVSGPASRQ
jgi:hypothetical protein